jgi:hypothetical protein
MPKTYKTEIIGYSFEELSEEVKRGLYEKDYDDLSHMVDLEPVEDGFREDLIEQYGADAASLEVYYDVSYSQGSGACCVANLNVDTILNTLLDNSKCHDGRLPIALHIVREKHRSGVIDIGSIQVVRCGASNHYNHENTCHVEINYTCDLEDVGDWEGEEITHIEEYLTEEIRDLLTEFHGGLQSYYEESTSFEVYCELMSDTDNIYTAEGKIVDRSFIKSATAIDGVQLSLDFDMK